jgi:hypothetical protein
LGPTSNNYVGRLSYTCDDHFTTPSSLKQLDDEVELVFKHQNPNTQAFEMCNLLTTFQMDDESNFYSKKSARPKKMKNSHTFLFQNGLWNLCKKNLNPELFLLFIIYKCWCKHSCVINCACWIETKINFHDCFKSRYTTSTCCTFKT